MSNQEPKTSEQIAVERLRHYANRIEAGELTVANCTESIGYEPPIYDGGPFRAVSWEFIVRGPLRCEAEPPTNADA